MLWAVLVLPLLGAVLNGLVLRNVKPIVSHIVGTGAVAGAFVAALLTYIPFMQGGGEASLHAAFEWISAGDLSVPVRLVLDRLSGMMLLVVTGIGSLIHVYAGGYMHEEEKTSRFFAYLNLFVFMMLVLVLGDSLLLMFVGWEGVGLCSYLLIGYWFTDDKNAGAGMKAFLVNRIGDIGFLLGIFLTFQHFGTLGFSDLRVAVEAGLSPAQMGAVATITLCLFIGACGKSAQIPLHIWLPDAMAGPTPVSALIHAATMVTAGIFMMTRLNFFFYLAPTTQSIVAFVGGATAFVAATIAITQTDIKKVLAYSTVSQLGYMVMGCGVGAFDAGVFHLLTHACFKALLFLGAGSVIVAMHHKQDMREMGGLRRYMPITYAVYLVGVVAIIGLPPFAGFFSKDEILWKAFLAIGPSLWLMGTMTAGLTSFYMVRLFCMTFHGPNRSDQHTREHLHETSALMWGPLVPLALLSMGIGFLGVPHVLGGHNMFAAYLEPVLFIPDAMREFWSYLSEPHSASLELALMGASVAVAALGAGLAIYLYGFGIHPMTDAIQRRFSHVYRFFDGKWFFDEFFAATIVKPLEDASIFLWKIVDVKLIDGTVNGVARAWSLFAGVSSFRMSGSLNRHGMVMMIGVICIFVLLAT